MKLYPLRWKPEFKERIWGGQELKRYHPDLPDGLIGEGWMISDHPNGITTILNGELAGMGLDYLRETYGEIIFGRKGFSKKNGRFPLLIKLLDCQDDLSVQVHPDDHYDSLPQNELGKSEMWYILDAKPGAKIIYGLKDGINRKHLESAIQENRIMECVNEITVKSGDSFYIPAGTVHALGAGIIVAEIQQNSDSTYRLYDYGRLGLDGKPRELHIEDSLKVIEYKRSETNYKNSSFISTSEWITLASTPFFITEKGIVEREWIFHTHPDSCIILIICEGTGFISWKNGEIVVHPGDCYLIPAQLGEFGLNGNMTVLRTQLPYT